jgi:hypothetical protein
VKKTTGLAALGLVLLLGGCTTTAERRRLVIHESKLVLRHWGEGTWSLRKDKALAECLAEDPDTEGQSP